MIQYRDKSLGGKFCRIMLTLLLLFFLGGCKQQEEPADSNRQSNQVLNLAYDGTIIAMGDSLTAGLGIPEEEAYPAVLQGKLHEAGYDWQVINAGISGETSSGALSRLNWIIAQHPDIVILETGANDGLRGIPIDVIRENINRIVADLKEGNIEVVLAGMQMLQNLGPVYTEKFKAIYPAVAAEQNVILVPFFLERVAGDPALNLGDGIHPTPAGHRIVARTVYPYVEKAIKKSR
jgi:acyl-CoA thioesterase I